MNKKTLLLGAVALFAGFFAFTAFDGKTLAQQKAEIAQMITMKLDDLRNQKTQECTDKVNAEAQRRFDEILAQREAEAAKSGKKPNKKTGGKGPSVDPLPNPQPSKPSEDKWKPGGTSQPSPSKDKWKPEENKQQPSPSKDKWGKPTGGGGK